MSFPGGPDIVEEPDAIWNSGKEAELMSTVMEQKNLLLRRREALKGELAQTEAALSKKTEVCMQASSDFAEAEARRGEAGASLQELRQLVESAVREIKALREERGRLSKSLEELDAVLALLDQLPAGETEEPQAWKAGEPEKQTEQAQAAAEKAPPRPGLSPYFQSRLDSVLQRLEAYYPDRVIRDRIDQAHETLGRDLTDLYKLLGYASRKEFLDAYGYQSPSIIQERRSTEDSTDVVKRKTENVLRRLEQYYPDHVIPGRLEQDHKSLSSDISEVYRLLGYESRAEFLNAYGYTYQPSVGGRPAQDFQAMLDALAEKYRDREKPTAMGVLLFENPEYKGPLKTLSNKAQELLGMTLVAYLRSIGVMAEKGAPRGRSASAARQEETASVAGLSPAATARLKDLYLSLNPRFYGTFKDAARKLAGLEAGCTRGQHARFCITGATDCPADVEIPQGFRFIQEGAFQNQQGLETIVLPESLTEIQASAFEGCTHLRRVILPAGLETVKDRAFAGCTALEEVDFQGGVPQVSPSAFEGSAYRYTPPEVPGDSDGQDFTYTSGVGGVTITGYTGTAEELDIPGTIQGVPVRMIAKGAFSGNRNLTEVTMPDTIQRVQGLAFEGCISLRKIHLSNAMTKLINTTFNGCTGLREVNIPDGVTALQERLFKDAALERVHIGKGLETLDPGCFFRSYDLEDGRNNHPHALSEITIDPENPHLKVEIPFVFSAGGRTLSAFFGTGICEIPEGVERIGPNAFSGRTGLTDVAFPSTLTEIGEHAFSYSPSLRRVEFGENLRIIGNSAFFYCERLSSVLFSEGLEEIGDCAFQNCPIHLVSLPSSLRKLGKDSFDCLKLYYDFREHPQELRLAPGGPIEADGDAVYQIEGGEKTLLRTYGPRLYTYYHYEEGEDYDEEDAAVLTHYTVAEGTTVIAKGAFENCDGLISVTLPDSLREIGARAFCGCNRLESIRLPHGLRSIGAEAFRGTAIAELVLPPEIAAIGDRAFSARAYGSGASVPRSIQVSAQNPHFRAEGNCLLRRKEDGSWSLMFAFGESETVTVPEGVTEIESLAFDSRTMQEIRIPSSVRDIARDAFRECKGLLRLRLEYAQPENGQSWAVFYFPEFLEDEYGYVSYSARNQYLDCIRTNRDGVFDIVKYDSLFPSIQEFKDRVLIATDRLKSAVQLVPLYRDEYLNWLRENAAGAVEVVIKFDDLAGLNTLAELGVFTGENIDKSIELANAARKPEVLSYLMNYKNAHIGITETDYEL